MEHTRLVRATCNDLHNCESGSLSTITASAYPEVGRSQKQRNNALLSSSTRATDLLVQMPKKSLRQATRWHDPCLINLHPPSTKGQQRGISAHATTNKARHLVQLPRLRVLMTHDKTHTTGLLIFLTVACGIALQLFLIRQATILVHVTAGFPVLASHIAGWGIGLGLLHPAATKMRNPAITAVGAACVAWLGIIIATVPGLLHAEELGTLGLVPTALGSGILTGMSIAAALAMCRNPKVALGADLAGVGLGALSHVLLTSQFPSIPAPVVWITLLALCTARNHLRSSLLVAAVGFALIYPLDHPLRLSHAQTPLGKALRSRGLEAWQGSFYDHDGRVDAVENTANGGVELFINGGTQAQTPLQTPDQVTQAIIELLRPKSAVVLGAGGMADVATLLRADVQRVVAVERSEAVLEAARTTSQMAERLFADDRVEIVHGEARRFITDTQERFDLVFLPLAYGSAGISPAALLFFPSYVFTIEGITAQGDAATHNGAVCFVFPTTELRDRLLATIGMIERQRPQTHPLSSRLWVVENLGKSAYSQAVCWAPHAPLPTAALSPTLKALHHPQMRASSALTQRLRGIDTLPPVQDWRPYFFDLFARQHVWTNMPPHLSQLLLWTPIGLLLMAMLLLWNGRKAHKPSTPKGHELSIAALTGFAFPFLEYVVLGIARGAGFSEGIAYAVAGITFAAAGFAAMTPHGSLRLRTLLSVVAMCSAAAFLHLDGISLLLALPAKIAPLCGLALMLALMTAGVSPFASLFRIPRTQSTVPTDVRQLFLTSALGTLIATAPVLLIELQWGGPGCAIAGGLVYLLALGVTLAVSVPASRT